MPARVFTRRCGLAIGDLFRQRLWQPSPAAALRPMSQGARSNASTFSAVGELAEDESVAHVFDDRRRTGGHRDYLCRLAESGESRWLKAADVPGECLTVWEAGEAARIDKRDYDRSKNSRKQKRDAEVRTEVQTFRDSERGKMLLSQQINTRSDAGPNRKSDCMRALGRMRQENFKLYTIRTSDPKRAEADAVKAGKAFGAQAGEFDYIGKHAFVMSGMKKNGKIPAEPTFARIFRQEGNPPDNRPREQDYFVSEVDEVVPLGIAVCVHEASSPTDVLDTLERHAIEERNKQPRSLRQHPGGKGTAINKRPKSDLMLLIYGARYKPDAYRAKIRRINEKKATKGGPRSRRDVVDSVKPVDESEDEPDAEPAPGAAGTSASGGLFSMFRR